MASKDLKNIFSKIVFSSSLFVLLVTFPLAAKAATGAYIANISGTGLTVVNLRTYATQSKVYVGDGPWSMTRSGTGMWVTNSNDDTISVVDITNNEVERTITGVGDRPTTIAFNGTGAYVVNENGGTVTIIDTTSYQVERTIAVGSSPIGIAISGTGAFVANSGSDTVSVIDIANNQVERTISVNSFPWFVAISGTGAYVSNGTAATVTVIDTTNSQVERTIGVGTGVRGIAINGTGAYVANATGNSVSVIDLARNIVVKTISVGNSPIGIGTTGTGVYVSNYDAGTVSVIDTTTNVVEGTITVGGLPHFLGFVPSLFTPASSSSSSSSSTGGGGTASWVMALRLQNGLNPDGTPKTSISSSSASSASSTSSLSSSETLLSAAQEAVSSSPPALSSSQSSEQSSASSGHTHVVTRDNIDLKDVWADDWFGSYVKKLVDLNIFEGYKDTKGKPLGLYGPADPITLGQLAKVGDLLSGQTVTPVLGTEWATPYLAAAKNAKLSVFLSEVDPKAPAKRGAVIQTILEAFGFPMTETDVSMYSDVHADSPHAAAIATATKLGIVSGDAGRTTFRPNAPVNRAEVAKMVVLALEAMQ